MAEALPIFPRFDPSPEAGDVVIRWRKWTGRFRNLMTAINVTNDARQKALLLHYVGEETNDIFETLVVPQPAEGETHTDVAIRVLTAHFAPKQNREFEVYKFRQVKQEKGEDIASLLTRLRQMAVTCEFADTDREIKTQLIQGCTSSRLRRKALSDPAMTLNQMVEQGRAAELSELQATGIEKEFQQMSVNKVSTDKLHVKRFKQQKQKSKSHDVKCRNCGKSWPHQGGKDSCSAKKKSVINAKKLAIFHLSVEAQISPQETDQTSDNALAQTADNALALSDRIPMRRIPI